MEKSVEKFIKYLEEEKQRIDTEAERKQQNSFKKYVYENGLTEKRLWENQTNQELIDFKK